MLSVKRFYFIVTKGIVFDIKRFAVHDGPGIRTTVFFKGCPLSCWWCHNPESRDKYPQKSVKHLGLGGKLFEKEEVTGYQASVAEIVAQVERDRIFYEESGGGVTLSGGEPLHQPEFCIDLLRSLKEKGIHTAMDTTGNSSEDIIRRAMLYTDLFLYDLKIMNDKEHLKYTGVSNNRILENLTGLFKSGNQVIIRFPVIPGITDSKENLAAMADFLSPYLHIAISPLEIHLLPYHTIGNNKYKRFNINQLIPTHIKMNPLTLRNLKDQFSKEGFSVKIGG